MLLRNRKNKQFCRQNQKLRAQSQNEYELNSLLVFVTKLFNSLHHSFSQADLQTIKIVSSPRNRRKINIWFKKKKIKFRPRTNTANQHILDHCFYWFDIDFIDTFDGWIHWFLEKNQNCIKLKNYSLFLINVESFVFNLYSLFFLSYISKEQILKDPVSICKNYGNLK